MRRNLTKQLKDYDVPYVLKTTAPTSSDVGYSVPIVWIDKTNKKAHLLIDVTSGVATWAEISGQGLPMTTSTAPAINAAVTTAIIDAYSGVTITLAGAGNAQTLQDPTDTTAGKRFTVVVKGAFDIEVNGITMTGGEAQKFIWDGASWVAVTAVDADDITFTPAQGLLSTKVQAAIEEAVKKLTVPCKEENTSALKKGQVLCATGASGEKLLAGLCNCTDPNKLRIGGLASTDIGQNASGFAVYKGELPGVDTRATNLAVNPNGETWAEGALLWATATGGGMSHTRPTAGRHIKAAISRKGSCDDDILVAISHENAIWITAASGEDIVLRMGDSAGSNKVSGRDYADNEVFSFDSDGKLIITGTKENVTSHSATEAVTAATMYGGIHKITGAHTLTLPAAVVGMSGMFRASTAAVFSIKAGAGCHFEMIDGTVLDNGDKQTSGGTKNAWLHIHCETANVWITSGQHGTMEDTGA